MADKLIKITLLEEIVNRDCMNLIWLKINREIKNGLCKIKSLIN